VRFARRTVHLLLTAVGVVLTLFGAAVVVLALATVVPLATLLYRWAEKVLAPAAVDVGALLDQYVVPDDPQAEALRLARVREGIRAAERLAAYRSN